MSPMQDLQHAIHFGIVSHLHLVSGSSGKMQTHRWCDPNHLTPRSILSFWLILELDKNVLIGFPLIFWGQFEHGTRQPNLLAPLWSSNRFLASPASGCWYGLTISRSKGAGIFYIYVTSTKILRRYLLVFHEIWLGVELCFPIHMKRNTITPHQMVFQFNSRGTIDCYFTCYGAPAADHCSSSLRPIHMSTPIPMFGNRIHPHVLNMKDVGPPNATIHQKAKSYDLPNPQHITILWEMICLIGSWGVIKESTILGTFPSSCNIRKAGPGDLPSQSLGRRGSIGTLLYYESFLAAQNLDHLGMRCRVNIGKKM